MYRNLVITLIMLGVANSGSAEERSFDLAEIIVTGELEETRIIESAGTVDVVTSEDIRRAGARNLDEAIQLLPGLYVRTGGEGTPRIDIRGLRTRQVILLLDGVPVNSAIDGQFDAAAIDVANIDRIKVTRGTSSLLYGEGGNAGVINIISKAGAESLQGKALAEFGEDGRRRGQASLRAGSHGWHAFLSASGFHQDTFDLSDDFNPTATQGPGARLNSDRTDNNFYGNLIWDALAEAKIGITGSYRKGYYGKPFEIRDQSVDIFARRPRFDRVDEYEGFSLNLTAQHTFAKSLVVRPAVFINRLDELTNGYDDTTVSTQIADRSFRQKSRSEIYGGRIQANYDFSDYGLSSAVLNCRHEGWHAAGYTVQVTSSGGKGSGSGTGGGKGSGSGGGKGSTVTAFLPLLLNPDQNICSTAFEHEIRIMDRIGLVGGIGYNWENKSAGSDDEGVTYLAGVTIDLLEGTVFNITHSRKIRFPTLRDLFEPGRANPGLRAETTYHYEAGIRHQFSTIPASLGVTVFRIDAEDFIEADSDGVAQNFEEDRFEGIEISGEIELFNDLNLRTGYTFMESKNLSSDATNRDLQNRPKHRLSIEADYQLPLDSRLYLGFLHIGESIELSRGSPPVLSQETGDYDVINLVVEKKFGNAGIFIRALNLLDEDYVESGGFPAPGRAVLLGGELNFGS